MADLEKKDELLENEGNKGTETKDTGLEGSKEKEDGSKSERTFTQEEVNRMMAREKKQGRAALLKELGYTDEKSAISASKSYNAWLEAQKSEEQKAAEKDAANDEALKEAQAKAELSEAKVEAMMLGCQPKYVDDVIALAVAKKTDDGDFKTIIGDLKKKYPVWFGKSSDDEEKDESSKTGQKGTGGSVTPKKKNSGKDDSGEQSMGSRLAASRRAANKSTKKSFWS